jgi:hypothetical protein
MQPFNRLNIGTRLVIGLAVTQVLAVTMVGYARHAFSDISNLVLLDGDAGKPAELRRIDEMREQNKALLATTLLVKEVRPLQAACFKALDGLIGHQQQLMRNSADLSQRTEEQASNLQQNDARVQESSAAAESLRERANSLAESVRSFRLQGDAMAV